jgi:hypothetical protein
MLAAAILNTTIQMIGDAHTRHTGAAEPTPAGEQR